MTGPSAKTRDAVYARAQFRCEVCGAADGPFAVHHRRPRAMGGTRRKDTNSPANLLLLCERDHAKVESRRTSAFVGGLLVKQHDDPATTPVRLVCGWRLLTSDGRYLPVPDTGDAA